MGAVRFADAALEQAVRVPSAVVHEHVERIRRRNPGATPAEVLDILDKEYLAVSMAAGGAVGAAAAVPAIGTGVSIALTTGNVATYFASSAAYLLAVASVYGIEVDDIERRQGLLLTGLLGADVAREIADLSDLRPGRWVTVMLTKLPLGTVKAVNRSLTRRFLRTQAATQGALWLGRIVPFGVGAVVGATGARALSRGVVRNARTAFGEPPLRFREVIEIVEVAGRDGEPLQLPTGLRR